MNTNRNDQYPIHLINDTLYILKNGYNPQKHLFELFEYELLWFPFYD